MPATVKKTAGTAAGALPAALDNDLLTIRDWLRFAVSLFNREKIAYGQGTDNAETEARWLINHVLHLPRNTADNDDDNDDGDDAGSAAGDALFLDARLSAGEKAALRAVLERRVFDREPAAYITGEAWLGDFSFRADKRAIIPRSYFLEYFPDPARRWIEKSSYEDITNITRIADICTGSGCLAIVLADAFPYATIDAADISADALALAAENVADYDLQDRISLWQGDVFENWKPFPATGTAGNAGTAGEASSDDPYDIIICNPPYEPAGVLETLPAEFRREPENALVSGADGLDVIRRLLPQAACRIALSGFLAIEIGGLRDAIEEEWPTLEMEFLPVADGTDSVVVIRGRKLRSVFYKEVKAAGKK